MFSKISGQFRTYSTNFARLAGTSSQKKWAGFAVGGGVILTSFIWYQRSGAHAQSQGSILDPKEFKKFPLIKVETVNHNTKAYTFGLPHSTDALHLPVASCVVVKSDKLVDEQGKPVIRPYTPISGILEDEKGSFTLAIKTYPQGKMSKFVSEMKLGDELEVKGPIAKISYTPNFKKQIGMIAGGSGITPMMQVLAKILSDKNDKTKVSLIFANIAEEDILYRDYFDKIAKEHADQIKVYYVLEKPPKNWTGGVGYVNPEHVKSLIPPPSDDNLVMVCGPPGMMGAISGTKAPDYSQGEIGGILKELGYTKSQVFKF